MPKIENLKVVLYDNLEHSHLFDDGFDKVSYGDAEYTLVHPADLRDELNRHTNDMHLEPLIKELENIPEGVFVALDG